MYSTLVSVALFSALAIQGALADFTVSTPQEITTCGSLKLKWDAVDNAKSYNVALVSSTDPCDTVIAELGDHKGTSMTWNATGLKVGQSLMVSVLADDIDEGWSNAVKVTEGDCAKTTTTASVSATSTATAGTTLVVNPAAGPSSAPAAPSDDGAQAVGAANSGVLGGSNGALSSVHFSASTLALSAVAAVAALAL
ncbi:hypothetical protein C8Q80DRAFT_1164112 [Daedaleopsis nitida]|nr:hypothetical protein C8Q80DRAFT_1164112 [Daedaleopsis nitida]